MASETIIFDFDGTIADSLALSIAIFRELTGWDGGRTAAEIKRMRKLPFRKVVKELGVPLYQVPSLLVRGRKMMANRIDEIPLFDGMADVLKTLHEQGHSMLIMSSNSKQNVEKFLHAHRLDSYFQKIYGGVGLLNKAAALRRTIRANRLDRKNCVYVGDEERDIDGAHKVRIKVVAVSWGYNDGELLAMHRPLGVAQKPADILKILQQ